MLTNRGDQKTFISAEPEGGTGTFSRRDPRGAVERWWRDGGWTVRMETGQKPFLTLSKEEKQRLEARTFKGDLVLPAALSHFWAVLPFF